MSAAQAPRTAEGSRVVGVLGGIASGKSAAARFLAGAEGVVLDADRIAREVLASDEVRAELVARFGPEILLPDGSPDRARLAERVFASREDRAALERLTHPRVRATLRHALDAARERNVPRIVLDVPLLLENDAEHGLARACDALVFVEADERARDARATATRGWPTGEVARREAAQMPLARKRERADFVIQNDGSLEQLEARCDALRRAHAVLR